MSLAKKRRTATPNSSPPRPKARKKEEEPETGPPVSHNAPRGDTDKSAAAAAPGERGQGIVCDVPPPARRSARFKCPPLEPGGEVLAGQAGIAPPPGDAQNEEPEPSGSPSQRPLLAQEDSDMSLIITLEDEQRGRRRRRRRKGGVKRKRGGASGEEGGAEGSGSGQEGESEGPEESQIEVEFDSQLDRELESKSRQHNLTSANVRNIIHEVITNEHVVAMMKAAINETEAIPVFEPKMTRSKLKEVVEKGVVIPNWSISPMKKPNEQKAPQFVDIPLEEEDSSDEEYRPDEDEEDETAEETFLESDIESTASSPRGSKGALARMVAEGDEDRSCSPTQRLRKSRHLRVEAVPMGPPPPPKPAGPQRPPRAPPECSFMEKLHAVEEELAISPICLEPYQALSGAAEGASVMACRTRSKRTLRDVPLGRLEAELRAPDITPDMYDCGSAPEDREWTHWLQGLMTSDMENDEEGDDDDDPEYNFLADIDEPDLEDYRNDRAVRITKKEVSDLMEELFKTFQDELLVQEQDEEGHEEEEEREEETPPQEAPSFNIPQTIRFEDPPAAVLTESHRTVKQQLEALRRHRHLLESQGGGPVLLGRPCALILTHAQKAQLQQQVQQHVQLLTQVHMLTSPVEALQSETATTRLFLSELESFAERGERARGAAEPGFASAFRACNLQGALSLLQEVTLSPEPPHPTHCSPDHRAGGRPSPLLPPQLAWLLATRPVFMYPELLPHCSLDPALHPPRTNSFYTPGEDNLVVLGLRNFSETRSPYELVCEYLIRGKGAKQLRKHVLNMCHRRPRDNAIKFYVERKMVPPMTLACGEVKPGEQRPPVEREGTGMPPWLRKSIRHIHEAVMDYNHFPLEAPPPPAKPSYTFPPNTRYPPTLPPVLTLHPFGFRRQRPVSVEAGCAPVPDPWLVLGHGADPCLAAKIAPCCHGGATAAEGRTACTEKCGPLREALSKMVPIQPAPPKPPPPPLPPQALQVLTVPAGGALRVPEGLARAGVATVVSGGAKEAGQSGAVHHGVPPAVIINVTAPLATAVVCPAPSCERLAGFVSEAPPPPQEGVALPFSPLALLGKFGRPLLPAPLRENTPTAPPGRTVRRGPSVSNGVPHPGNPQKPRAFWDVVNVLAGPSGEADGGTVGPKLGGLQNQPPSGPRRTLSAPAGGPKYALVSCGPSAAPHVLLLPQNCAIADGMPVSASVPAGAQNEPGDPQESRAEAPTRGPPPSSKISTVELEWAEQGEGWEEEEEEEKEGECDGQEEPEAGDFGGPLLALSESSGSPASSPRTPEKMDAEEGGGEGWSGLLTSTPQHSPQGKREGEGLDDVASEEEEVMSPASEQSLLSVPELQETMEKLSMLASEGRESEAGETDDGESPNSLASPPSSSGPQNPEERAGTREGEKPREGGASQSVAVGGAPRSRGKRFGKSRGNGRHPRTSVKCSGRQELDDGDASKPLLVGGDDDTLSSDPLRESKDMAFARAYLRRVCAAVRGVPGKVEEFLRVLYEFEQGGEGRSSVELFEQLKLVLRDRPDLLWDFAAFLRPEQARECGLLAEQQAFERSRHFLRQLETSFGESPAHYRQIVRALQEGPGLSPAGLRELKAQMASMLKHHTHLQGEFWDFFDELHTTSSQSVHLENTPFSEVGEGTTVGQESRTRARGQHKKDKLPVSQEGEEPHKAGPMMVRRRKKGNFGCRNPRKGSVSRATKGRGLSPPETSTPPPAAHPEKRLEEREEERRERGKECEEEEEPEEEDGQRESGKAGGVGDACGNTPAAHRTLPSPDPPVCAKNVSLTPTGQKVILWTREADRIILTACQRKGANQRTFQAVSAQLGNKTANEVSLRFRELVDLFHSAARPGNKAGDPDQLSASEDEPD
ncbi:GON-4-like protein isoform X2 [Anguilla anguilla]|uniref:GON-4-like protein isoform X2 n=1 Tax=Anguilla anguilla TaxID=7936 RepID=UPI0015B033A9|nr:GON-4-like protein isoform X2 [Anguilla anguilla]